MAPMKNIKAPLPPFENDVEVPEENPTFFEQMRNADIALILGIVIVHLLFHGSMIFARLASGEAFTGLKILTF